MRVLVDTHTFIWYLNGEPSLSETAIKLIESDTTDVSLSMASLWEISIKNANGKLNIGIGYESMPDVLARYSIDILPIYFDHTLEQNKLPFHHKDPFDRMIAAQAIVTGIDLISKDDIFDSYFIGTEVKRIW
jgi:PIN domain nuclease of toxin-antitoxin system